MYPLAGMKFIGFLMLLGVLGLGSDRVFAQPGPPPGGGMGAPPPAGMGEGMPRRNQAPVSDGRFRVMTVDGVETPMADGTYSGEIVIHALDGAEQTWYKQAGNVYRSALLVEEGAIRPEHSALSNLRGGHYDAQSLEDVSIAARSPWYNGITVVDQAYSIRNLTADFSGDGGNDMEGTGAVVAVFGDSQVELSGSEIVTHGTARSTVFAGSDDMAHPARLSIADSTLIAHGNNTVEPTSVWMLGLFGDVRAAQYVGYFDNSYDHVTIQSAGWAVLSVDEVGPATQQVLDGAGLTAAYDAQTGYGNRTPDDMLGLYYWSGTNRLYDSELSILSIEDGGWGDGYGTYSIGPNRVVFDHSRISNVSYGAIVANEYASVSFENGSVVDSNRFGVYSHSNQGGVINVDKSEFNTRRPVFLLKSSDAMFGPNATMIDVTDSILNNSGDGVILLFMDNDDPGGGAPVFAEDGKTRIDEKIEIRDAVAVRDPAHDLTREFDYRQAKFAWADTSYMFNANPVAYFTNCKDDSAIRGDFYNARTHGQNLVLHFRNSEVEGVISSGSTKHDVDVILKSMKITDADYSKDGLRYGNRNNLGEVSVTASEPVNNGVIVYLEDGSVWAPRNTSYLSKLVLSADSEILGSIEALSSSRAGDGTVTYLGAVVTEAAR